MFETQENGNADTFSRPMEGANCIPEELAQLSVRELEWGDVGTCPPEDQQHIHILLCSDCSYVCDYV